MQSLHTSKRGRRRRPGPSCVRRVAVELVAAMGAAPFVLDRATRKGLPWKVAGGFGRSSRNRSAHSLGGDGADRFVVCAPRGTNIGSVLRTRNPFLGPRHKAATVCRYLKRVASESGLRYLFRYLAHLASSREMRRGRMERKEAGVQVQQIMADAKFTMLQWAELIGRTHDVLRNWSKGQRVPNDESLDALAEGLEKQAERNRAWAAQLRALRTDAGTGSGAGRE